MRMHLFKIIALSIILVSGGIVVLISCGTDSHFERGEPRVTPSDTGGGGRGVDPRELFTNNVLPNLQKSCAKCKHPNNIVSEYTKAKTKIDPGNPEGSELYLKATGNGHMGGTIWALGTKELEALREWIEAEGLPKGVDPSVDPNKVTLDEEFYNDKVHGLLNTNVEEAFSPGCSGCHGHTYDEKLEKEKLEKGEKGFCLSCHSNGPPAIKMKWDFNKASMFVVPGKPEESRLYQIASGQDAHRFSFTDFEEEGEKALLILKNWIEGVKLGEEPVAALAEPVEEPPPVAPPQPAEEPEVGQKMKAKY